jgi:site-specific DNA recombinase
MWERSTIAFILKNESYTGTTYNNRYRREGKRIVERPRNEWIPVAIPAIIDAATFKAVQKRMADNKATMRGKPDRKFALGGMVFCAKCKRVYGAVTERAKPNGRTTPTSAYRHREGRRGCENKQVTGKPLLAQVWSALRAGYSDVEALKSDYRAWHAKQHADTADARRELETLTARKTHLEGRKKRASSFLLDGTLDRDEYRRQREAIEAEIASIVAEVDRLNDALASVPTEQDEREFLDYAASVWAQLEQAEHLPEGEQRRVFKGLNLRVWMDSGKVAFITTMGNIAPGELSKSSA